MEAEGFSDELNEPCAGVGEGGHVDELEGGPGPRVGFAADDGEGADALHGENVEDHEADTHEGGVDGIAIWVRFFSHVGDEEFGVIVRVFDVVDDGHGADEHLAGSE